MREYEFPKLGFGVLRLPCIDKRIDMVKTQKMIDEYMKGSFCYFDMHIKYMYGQAERLVRELVVERYPRDSFLLADKVPYYVKESSDYEKYFRGSLENCGVSYFDYYMLHAITREVYERHERLGGFEYLQKLKKEGKVCQIGFSFHDRPELLDEILTKHPEMDFVQLQINYLDWESSVICARECYEIARKHNKPIFVMEPIKGGSLANRMDSMNADKEIQDVDLVEIALKFVASLPGIDVVLSGMSEVEHVIQNRKILDGTKRYSLDEKDNTIIQMLRKKMLQDYRIQCTACQYCIENCSKKIPIPEILSLINACGNIGEYDRTYLGRFKIFYNSYVFDKGTASSCIQCGKCETVCPQKLSIREYLIQAAKLFEQSPAEIKQKRILQNYRTLREWMAVLQSGSTLESFFIVNGYRSVAVYGIGEIGELLLKEIDRYEMVHIAYGIDKKAKLLVQSIPVIEPNDTFRECDVIIVTPTFDFENIEKQLSEKVTCPIVSLDTITKWCLQYSCV